MTEDTILNNPFDPEKLRLSQNFVASAPVEKVLTMVPIRNPDKQWFVRVHPDAAYQMEMLAISIKEESEFYPVMPELGEELAQEVRPMLIRTAINRTGTVFLWPVPLPDADGKHNSWHKSALDAQEAAKDKWVRILSNKSLGGYEVLAALGEMPAPIWPQHTFPELLKITFKDKIINSLGHPIVKKLRGQI